MAGAVLLFPSLLTLFRLALGGRLGEGPGADARPAGGVTAALAPASPRKMVRVAGALLGVGVGLVNVADSEWEHIVGAACFLAFVISGATAALPRAGGGD